MFLKFWPEAFNTAVHLINILPIKILQFKCPQEVLTKVKPDYENLKIFGCQCFPCLRSYNTHKLDFRSTPCTFLGYSNKQKGYRCLDNKGKIYISRHVRFNEQIFPYSSAEIKTTEKVRNPRFMIPDLPEEIEIHPSVQPLRDETITSSKHTMAGRESGQEQAANEDISDNQDAQSQGTCIPSHDHVISDDTISCSNNNSDSIVRDNINVHPMLTRAKCGIYKPKIVSNTVVQEEPSSYIEAAQNNNWRAAMQEEYNALINKKTWDLVEKPENKNIIGCRWTFKLKKMQMVQFLNIKQG